jgi:hypothetical protein
MAGSVSFQADTPGGPEIGENVVRNFPGFDWLSAARNRRRSKNCFSLACVGRWKKCPRDSQYLTDSVSSPRPSPVIRPVYMRQSGCMGPQFFWSEAVGRTEEELRAANAAGVW